MLKFWFKRQERKHPEQFYWDSRLVMLSYVPLP